MNPNSRARIFLDGGGTGYSSPSEPVDDVFDGNKWIYTLIEDYKRFLGDRILVEEMIARLDKRLYSAGWFIPLGYALFSGDSANEEFVGSYAKKYEQAKAVEMDFALQVRVSFEQDAVVDLLVNVENSEKDRSLNCARVIADSFNAEFDTNESYLDMYNIGEISLYDNDLELRSFANDSKFANCPMVTMVFGVEPGGSFADYLQSEDGKAGLLKGLNLAFDSLVETGLVRGNHD